MPNLSGYPILMLLAFLSLAYIFIIYIRTAVLIAYTLGFEDYLNQFVIVAVFLALIGLVGSSMFLSAAAASVFMGALILTMLVFFFGGMASGTIFREGDSFLSPVLLLVSELTLVFIEPFITAPFCIAMVGWNIYRDYDSFYGLVYLKLEDNEFFSTVFVFPPMILILVLTNVLIVSVIIPQWVVGITCLIMTLLGFGQGYFSDRV